MSEWHERLKRDVPRTDIPRYLEELQALVAALRRYRDDLKVPDVETVDPLLTPLLRAHGRLTADYIGDARYARVVAAALGLDATPRDGDQGE